MFPVKRKRCFCDNSASLRYFTLGHAVHRCLCIICCMFVAQHSQEASRTASHGLHFFLRFHPTEKKHRKKSWDEMMKRCGVQFGCKSKPFVQRHQCFYPMELVVRDDFHCRVVCCLPFMEVVRFSEKCQWNEGQLFSGPSLCHFHTHQEENSYSC